MNHVCCCRYCISGFTILSSAKNVLPSIVNIGINFSSFTFCYASIGPSPSRTFTMGSKTWTYSWITEPSSKQMNLTSMSFKDASTLAWAALDCVSRNTCIFTGFKVIRNIPKFPSVSNHFPSHLLKFYFVKKCFNNWLWAIFSNSSRQDSVWTHSRNLISLSNSLSFAV